MTDLPPSLRDGRYAVIRLLGEGGQASTFEGVDKKLGLAVVLKRFRVRGAQSWKQVELAEREAKVLASVSHPALPRYVDHFEEGGELFLVTEKIEGDSLAELLRRGKRFSEADVLRFLREASEALDYLHGRAPPVVHRDIKPSNVLRRPDGSFSFIDFGAVRDRMKPDGGSTVVGTFGFMAPEQFQGRAMPASDVYAVGATALVMLTGQEPEDLPHRGLGIDVEAALARHTLQRSLTRSLGAMLDPDPDRRASRIAPLLSSSGPAAKAREGLGREKPSKRGKHEKREERKLDRAQKKEARRQRREARALGKAESWARWAEPASRGAFVPFPLAVLFRVGLLVAEIAVVLALRVVVPIVLGTLSILFGRGMRDAARQVSDAGTAAAARIRRGREDLGRKTASGDGVWVELPEGRVRVDGTSGEEDKHEATAEAEAEAEAEEDVPARRAHRRG